MRYLQDFFIFLMSYLGRKSTSEHSRSPTLQSTPFFILVDKQTVLESTEDLPFSRSTTISNLVGVPQQGMRQLYLPINWSCQSECNQQTVLQKLETRQDFLYLKFPRVLTRLAMGPPYFTWAILKIYSSHFFYCLSLICMDHILHLSYIHSLWKQSPKRVVECSLCALHETGIHPMNMLWTTSVGGTIQYRCIQISI